MIKLSDSTLTETPVDAATVILVRDHPAADHGSTLQTLLLCRSSSRTLVSGTWVFPGGKVDPADLQNTDTTQTQLTAPAALLLNEPELDQQFACALFHAACRETFEETGVKLEPSALQTWSRWITPNNPAMINKRFDARFFIAAMPDGQTAVHDGSEATDSQWCTPQEALKKYAAEELIFAPPQIMTLLALTKHQSVESSLDEAANTESYTIQPNMIKTSSGRTLTYPGDQEHPDQTKRMPGPTRLVWTDGHFEPPGGFEPYLK